MENLRNWIDFRLVGSKQDYLKWTLKPSCLSQEIFDNDLVAIRKSKVTLTLNEPAYVWMCILNLSKVLSINFNSIMITLKISMVISQDYYLQTLIQNSKLLVNGQ